MTTPAQNHAQAAATLADRIAGTTYWDAPTPVKEWRARQVVEHLLEWFPGLIAAGCDVRLSAVDASDLGAAWAHRSAEIQAVLDDPTVAGASYTSSRFGELTVADLVDRFYTADVVMHTWDLARATGQDDTMPEQFVRGAYEGMTQMAEVIRSSGQFGDQQPVADDAPLQDRFLAFIGRDPAWMPPA